ncbi:single strand DNA binding protein [Pediococcus phage cIP1]|uniref:Uncharacterized protein n=1 Tax=Pediococcus phage cIP1 TaxID=2681621 RepID=G8FV18_9CAUD|nr:single strand DNA binding protein [Pediococcus phage cIP1]AER59794.1 hypothetical protein clP1_035 [Pediococcus phage cIP1]
MSLLDKIKKAQAQPRLEYDLSDLKNGTYDGKLISIKQDTLADYEVYKFDYEVVHGEEHYRFEDVMFVNSDVDKLESQVMFRVVPFYEAGIVKDAAIEKAMSNLPGFFNYIVEKAKGIPVKVRLKHTTYNGKERDDIVLQSVKVPKQAESDDAPF